ncbi:hypothetical protein BKA83DRAFT_4232946 [Pisolithus microcarpus]|nr:hypothetical protein BKA83DRAFT_4342811 [Pisolithus microcarpus]KAI6027752.1 hypothetical protein BKA83DRAFT_4232946 [Pisolithus microcarpus]
MTEDDDTIDVEAVPSEQAVKETHEREAGKSVLPFSRVQKIIKVDKDLPMVARDATFLISMATEEFIKRLAQASQKVAEREKRSTVQQRDVATVTRRADEFFFLDEIISGPQPATTKRKPKALQEEQSVLEAPTLLDRFMKKTEVVTDMDGLMYATHIASSQ